MKYVIPDDEEFDEEENVVEGGDEIIDMGAMEGVENDEEDLQDDESDDMQAQEIDGEPVQKSIQLQTPKERYDGRKVELYTTISKRKSHSKVTLTSGTNPSGTWRKIWPDKR